MDIIKSYKRNVVENKSIVFVSIFIACFLRLGFFYTYDQPDLDMQGAGYLWTSQIVKFISNDLLSLLLSLIFTIGIVIYSSVINSKHKLIRSRTFLIYVFTILFFSSHPVFIYMNHQYITLLLLLVCLDLLMGSYQLMNAAGKAYGIGFVIAIASLFSFNALIYLPLFWIGFRYMRSLGFKTILASLFGLATIYWIVFSYFLWQNDVNTFLQPFHNLYPFFYMHIVQINFNEIALLSISAILLLTMIITYWSTSFYDKIQTRANLSFIFLSSVLSFLFFVFINYDPVLFLYVFISSGSFLLAHFFTLTDEKWKVHMFYIFMTLYFIVCIYFLSNKVITAILAV